MTSVKAHGSARLPPSIDEPGTAPAQISQQPAHSAPVRLSGQQLEQLTALGETTRASASFASQNEQALQVAKQQRGVLELLSAEKASAATVPEQAGPAWGEKSVLEHARDFGAGVKVAATDTVVGIRDMAVGAWNMSAGWLYDRQEARATWLRTSTMVKGIVDNPRALLQAMAEPYKEAWREGRPMEAIGRGTLEAAAVMLTTKGLDKVTKLAQGARAGAAMHKVSVAGRITQKVAENMVVRTAYKGKRIYEGGMYASMSAHSCMGIAVVAAANLPDSSE